MASKTIASCEVPYLAGALGFNIWRGFPPRTARGMTPSTGAGASGGGLRSFGCFRGGRTGARYVSANTELAAVATRQRTSTQVFIMMERQLNQVGCGKASVFTSCRPDSSGAQSGRDGLPGKGTARSRHRDCRAPTLTRTARRRFFAGGRADEGLPGGAE